jgi:hypothetical protein
MKTHCWQPSGFQHNEPLRTGNSVYGPQPYKTQCTMSSGWRLLDLRSDIAWACPLESFRATQKIIKANRFEFAQSALASGFSTLLWAVPKT